MKAKLCVMISCILLFFSSYAFAGCGSCNSCDEGGVGQLDYTSSCDCTDPACGPFAYNDCLSSNRCCEAFGNIGAR